MLEAHNVSVQVGQKLLLKDIDFSINPGSLPLFLAPTVLASLPYSKRCAEISR